MIEVPDYVMYNEYLLGNSMEYLYWRPSRQQIAKDLHQELATHHRNNVIDLTLPEVIDLTEEEK